ncbi:MULTISPECIES: efflux RND transporter periplasmic adaptor subunit [Vibrio]|uniref:Membrane protein n=1 Tax=Vibrio navarrensis TaxID=29495 RepID=A0A099LY61_9VIBR|nr:MULTISPECIES: efflux RND transporter periplasmic adaptor subunit [Vibrio]EJL6393333.1 efflux RND transporter periplasmic adaptor subunit [Vibrio navarrensis]KGK12321.1 membrane protein [Vibrio navarrensis]KGK14387.1 membrane protein [Vibrio navarrensis]MBE4599990.1 efflux transporter periplasmic adaptor subunit [Vibrio navarrensis]MBE4614537.1 efflux transporter periplasmic adaptor subunit [Vibrio navarrensis]
MLHKSVRWLVPVALLGSSYLGYQAIAAHGPVVEEKKVESKQPTVEVAGLFPTNHRVLITSHGELVPFEVTRLSAQVSGEVTSWHANFVSGGIVKRGEVLFTIESDNYEAAVLQAEAALASAQATLIEERAKAKVAEKQASKLSDKQVSDLYLRKPQLLSAEAQVKSAQAALKRAKRDLQNCKVIAPYDALVVSRNLGVGQFISAGSEVAVLNNIEAGEIHLPIAGFDSAFLPEKLSDLNALVTLDGIQKTQREGKVVRDQGLIDSATRMTNVVVRISDPYGINSKQPAIKFGSYVEVNFAGKELKHIYRLPQELVNNRTVWVVNENNELQPRTVNVLRAEGEFMLIAEGIEQSDQLVLTVPEYPQKGMTVKLLSAEADSNDKQG